MSERSFGVILVGTDSSGDSVLLVRHPHGHWGFPKGRAEEGEIPEETALRELAEETGIRDITLFPHVVFEERYPINRGGTQSEKQVMYYLAKTTKSAVRPEAPDVLEAQWVPLAEAEQAITFKEGKEIWRAAQKFLLQSK